MRRLAISNIAWPVDNDAEALDLVRDAGFGGIELAPAKSFGPWATIDLAQVRRSAGRLAAGGLPVVALQGLLFGVPGVRLFGDAAEQAALHAHLVLIARIAGACGGVPCVFGAPSVRDPGALPDDAAMAQAATFFRRIAPVFAAEGASLAFEANPAAYGCRFVTGTDQAIALVRAVAQPGFGLQIDTGTLLMNGEPDAWLTEAVPLAVHLHASAPQLGPVAPYAAEYQRYAHVLRQAGWDGWVSVEMRSGPGWRSAIRAAGAALRQAWA